MSFSGGARQQNGAVVVALAMLCLVFLTCGAVVPWTHELAIPNNEKIAGGSTSTGSQGRIDLSEMESSVKPSTGTSRGFKFFRAASCLLEPWAGRRAAMSEWLLTTASPHANWRSKETRRIAARSKSWWTINRLWAGATAGDGQRTLTQVLMDGHD
jgi:hypothetical protein